MSHQVAAPPGWPNAGRHPGGDRYHEVRLVGWSTAQDSLTLVGFGSFINRQNLYDRVGKTDNLTLFVKAVVVSYGAAPGDIVQTVPDTVRILVVTCSLEALRRDIYIIVG